MYTVTKVSRNSKTGPIPVTYSTKANCPNTCPLKDGGGCYAEGGRVAMHWKKVTNGERGVIWSEFLDIIRTLPIGTLWRHNIAGDLPHTDGELDKVKNLALARANKRGRKRGFTYTHHALTPNNVSILRRMNALGFTVNASANNVQEAARVKKETGLPTVTLLPANAPNVTPIDGERVVACPAEKSDRVNCSNCGLCAKADRDYIVGFRAHGNKAKAADLIAVAA